MPSDSEIIEAATAIALHAGGQPDPGVPVGLGILDALTEPLRKDVLEKAQRALLAAERVRNHNEDERDGADQEWRQ